MALRFTAFAARALLQDSHDHDHGHEEAGGEHAGEAGHGEETLPLRIAALFVIFAAALACGLPPLFLRHFQSADGIFGRIARTFAGGVILGLALIHIIPEAVEELDGLTAFHHLGGVAVVFGILVLVILDNWLLAAFASKAGSPHAAHVHAPGHKDPIGTNNPISGAGHTHQCLSSISAHQLSAAATADSASGEKAAVAAGASLALLRQKVAAYSMELGCVFHSVIIGVGVGVILDNKTLVITLLIALAVHQGLEGLALGSVLAMIQGFTLIKKILMVVVYAITTPLGIAIGIAVAETYDSGSVTARAVQGTISGVSGGMLLYIAMYQLIGEEFSREDMLHRTRLRWGMYAALVLGAAAMAVLAIWA